MQQGGKRLMGIGVLAMMVGALGLAGCNRHQAHDEDEDDPTTAERQSALEVVTAEAPPATTGGGAPATPNDDGAAPVSGDGSAGRKGADTLTNTSDRSAATAAVGSADAAAANATPPAASRAEPGAAAMPAELPVHNVSAGKRETPAATRIPAAAAAWWATNSSSPFTVRAVGSASDRLGIVVVLSKDIGDATAAGQHVHVLRRSKPVTTGNWHAGANARVLVFEPILAGRYDVVIDAGLPSADGQTFGSQLHGPVLVR